MIRILKILIDGQAWLYANQLKLQHRMNGAEVTEAQFKAWEDEWKRTTDELFNLEVQE